MTVPRSLWAAACVCLASGCSPTPPPPAPVFEGPPGVLGLTLIGAGSTAPPSLDAARTALGQHLPGMSLVSAVPKVLTGPVVLMESLDRQGFQPPAPATLRRQGRGLSEADIVHITNTDHALAMVFVTPSPDQLQTVTQASALAVELALQTGAYIQDDDTLEVFGGRLAGHAAGRLGAHSPRCCGAAGPVGDCGWRCPARRISGHGPLWTA